MLGSQNQTESICHYLPVTSADVEWGGYVVGAGRHRCQPGEVYPPEEHPTLYHYSWRTGRTLPEYRITLVSNGGGTFESEAVGSVQIEGAALLLVFPNEWHRYKPSKTTGWTERWVSANGTQFHRLYQTYNVLPTFAYFPLLPSLVPEMQARFDDFLQRIHSRPAQNSRLLSLHALSLFGDLLQPLIESNYVEGKSIAPMQKIDDPTVLAALEYIWTRSHCPLSVHDVAKQLTVSRRTLDRKFAIVIGHSVLDEINYCRLGRAKRLLRETDLPVKAIAHMAGFGSREGMRIAFRTFINTSPRQWRATARMQS
ncbi:helix-turn-helix domain-containing protein [Aeoliella sp. SH292]|uniref:helix-turn-helix domain-containing protein n=1 Tax=Aeoliella sp. SH292 TaxID=3454464 RepID=UPI003F96DC77